jgi:hypothetical protein
MADFSNLDLPVTDPQYLSGYTVERAGDNVGVEDELLQARTCDVCITNIPALPYYHHTETDKDVCSRCAPSRDVAALHMQTFGITDTEAIETIASPDDIVRSRCQWRLPDAVVQPRPGAERVVPAGLEQWVLQGNIDWWANLIRTEASWILASACDGEQDGTEDNLRDWVPFDTTLVTDIFAAPDHKETDFDSILMVNVMPTSQRYSELAFLTKCGRYVPNTGRFFLPLTNISLCYVQPLHLGPHRPVSSGDPRGRGTPRRTRHVPEGCPRGVPRKAVVSIAQRLKPTSEAPVQINRFRRPTHRHTDKHNGSVSPEHKNDYKDGVDYRHGRSGRR